MQSVDEKKKKRLKLLESNSESCEMPVTDSNVVSQGVDECSVFPIEGIVRHPFPGYVAPISISFNSDDSVVTFLFSPDNSLNKKVFSFDLKSCKEEMCFSPPDGGVDESNISAEEKMRRERLRERGLGVTRYEWVKTSSVKKVIMVPLPAGIYFQDLSCSKPELKMSSSPPEPYGSIRLLFFRHIRDLLPILRY